MSNTFDDMFKNLSEMFDNIFGVDIDEPHEEFDSADESPEE